MSQMKLVAAVMLLCHVDGKRVSFAPGDEITVELPAHDVQQLIRQGSVRDVTAEAAAAAAQQEQEKARSAAFLAAREGVMSEQEAVATPPAEPVPAEPSPADAKGSKKAKAA